MEFPAQNHHFGVQLSPELSARPTDSLGDQPGRHIRARTGGQRSSSVETTVVAAGGVRIRGCLELLGLRPDRHELRQLGQQRRGTRCEASSGRGDHGDVGYDRGLNLDEI